MRTFSGVVAAALLIAVSAAAAKEPVRYASPQAAFEQGLGAYKAGYYEIAIPALEEAAAHGTESAKFFARFYLARIYSDNSSPRTNHPRAYALFQKLADDNADLDPDDTRRAPFVAKALTALAGYLQRGLDEIKLRPDTDRATEYLHHAATFFGDKDAQFELAKIYLGGGRSGEDAKRGMHYLSVLTEEGHPAAQALLADFFWRGRYVKKDERRALALITMAVENAPAHERIWIEDIYQNIFCGTSQGTRKQADGIVALWRKMFARPSEDTMAASTGLGHGELQLRRACGNGEVIDVHRTRRASSAVPAAAVPQARPEVMQGSVGGGLRDVGERPK